MSEPIIFQLARQLAQMHGVPFAEVEAGLYGEVRPAPSDLGRKALVKNAVASGCEPSRVSPLARRASVAEKMKAQVEGCYPITAEAREEYAYCLDERVSVYVYEGLPERCGSKEYHGGECCARHLAIAELGCLEFWAYPKHETCVVRVPTPRPVGFCSRCESVGHVVASCPFGARDADVRNVAHLRRERRARREAAA